MIERFPEPQGARTDIVTQRVAHQRGRKWPQVVHDDGALFICRAAFDNLLSGPCAILVNTDGGEMRGDTFEHGDPERMGSTFKQFLYDGITDKIACKLCD